MKRFLLILLFPAFAGADYQITSSGSFSVIYDLEDQSLQPNEEIILDVPLHLQSYPVEWVAVTHRQSPNEERECASRGDRDCLPGYTSVEILSTDKSARSQDYRYWAGSGSGPFNSKFAEIRSGRGETDNLYEWQNKGHISVLTKRKSFDPLYPQKVRIRSVGKDSIRLQKLALKVLPAEPSVFTEFVFSSEFRFGTYSQGKGLQYPRGSSYGYYGGALTLNRKQVPRHSSLSEAWIRSPGKIELPLDPSTRLISVDVACGDMKPVPPGADPQNYRGGGRMLVEIRNSNKIVQTFIHDENVGTRGVMRGFTEDSGYLTQPGDVLVITAPRGTVQVMGLRLGVSR